MMSVKSREQKIEMGTKRVAMKRFVSRVEAREFIAAARVATEHDAAKIVNNSAAVLGNAGVLYSSASGLWLYLRNKQEAGLEQRKVAAMELMAQAMAKEAGIELPNPRGEKKSVALADTIGVKSPFARWVCLVGSMDGVSHVASKGVTEFALSA